MVEKILVTGSCGLIGSQAVSFYTGLGCEVHGIDNNMRNYFFGKDGDTNWRRDQLLKYDNYHHHSIDIRDGIRINEIFKKYKFNLIIHAAAQPSHDWAANEPITDFTVNANGTLNLLESFRLFSPEATFIFTSTNKVYGDTPNNLNLIELETRWESLEEYGYSKGVSENMSIDQSKHSLFGASKVAADILVQEYGRYFGLNTASFRGGCLTGPSHSGAQLHGFLSYLVKCFVYEKPYTIFGYKGKQVRDNIHSWDLIHAFDHYHRKANNLDYHVFNIGGSRHSNISVLEAIKFIEDNLSKKKLECTISKRNREGDHIWYISDISRFRSVCPEWEFSYTIGEIIEEIYKNEYDRSKK